MALNYELGGPDKGKPKPMKAPGRIKRMFVNKDKAKFDSGEEKEYLNTDKKTYSVNQGTKTTHVKNETKQVRTLKDPGSPARTEYKPARAFTKSDYPETSSPEEQAEKAGKPTTEHGRRVEEGYQKAVADKKDTFIVTHAKSRKPYKFKAGETTTIPAVPPTYETRTQTLSQNIEEPDIKTMKYGKGHLLHPKKVSNVKDMFSGGYDNKNRKNILNQQRRK